MSKEMGLVPDQQELAVYQVIAKQAHMGKFVENRGGEAGILSMMLMARELGIPPMQALMGGLNNIQGKVEVSPRLMNSMIRKAGHKIEILKCDNTHCSLLGTRSDTGERLEVIYSIEDAKRAGIYKGAWEKYPDDMCFKSALSKLARRLFTDVISTAYIEGEISEPKETLKPEDKQEAIQAEVIEPMVETLSFKDILEIEAMIGEDIEILNRILKTYGKTKLSEIEKSHYPTIKNGLEKKYGKVSENT